MSAGQDLARREAIEEYDVVGATAEPDLERLVELAAAMCDVPTAVINIIDDRHQHQVAAVGLPAAVCAREDSMCARILGSVEQVAVPDASLDDRFRDNPFVTGQIANVRFYASSPLVTPAGVPIGTLCVFDDEPRDLSETGRRALDVLAGQVVHVLELKLLTRELERSNEHLSKFAGQVCHDLRNPLAALSWFIELAAGSPQLADADNAAKLLARAELSAARMGTLISDLLAFARSGGGGRSHPVDLGAEVAVVLDDLAWQIGAVAADVGVGPLPVVTGEASLLRVLLQNLLVDAITSGAAGGRHGPVVRVGAERISGGWRVTVADDGSARPQEHGAGLDTCRRIADLHGGRLGLTDSALGGVTRWVSFPDESHP